MIRRKDRTGGHRARRAQALEVGVPEARLPPFPDPAARSTTRETTSSRAAPWCRGRRRPARALRGETLRSESWRSRLAMASLMRSSSPSRPVCKPDCRARSSGAAERKTFSSASGSTTSLCPAPRRRRRPAARLLAPRPAGRAGAPPELGPARRPWRRRPRLRCASRARGSLPRRCSRRRVDADPAGEVREPLPVSEVDPSRNAGGRPPCRRRPC